METNSLRTSTKLERHAVSYIQNGVTNTTSLFLTQHNTISWNEKSGKEQVLPFSIISGSFIKDKKLVEISCKDFRKFVFEAENEEKAQSLHVMVETNFKKVLPIEKEFECDVVEEYLYNARRELFRQGYKEEYKVWKVVEFQEKQQILPYSVHPKDLQCLADVRENGFFPLCTWSCWDINSPFYGASLLRCARPNIFPRDSGEQSYLQILSGNYEACFKDRQYIMNDIVLAINNEHTHSNLKECTLTIIDTGKRSQVLNDAYPDCNFLFKDLNSNLIYTRFESLFKEYTSQIEKAREFPKQVEDTLWSSTIIKYLLAARECVSILDGGGAVVIQDGDEISSNTHTLLACLVQIMIDPYYRTVKGFATLIFKDWICYGYPTIFHKPHAVFCLFIHSVSEMHHHHPELFEFNEKFLIWVLDNIYTTELFRYRHMDSQLELTMGNFSMKIHQNLSDFKNTLYDSDIYVNGSSWMLSSKPHSWYSYYLRYNTSVVEEINQIEQNIQQLLVRKKPEFLMSTNGSFFLPPRKQLVSFPFIVVKNSQISTLPDDFGTLFCLRKLNLDSNRLTELPYVIGALPSLEILSMNRNAIRVINTNVTKLTSLIELHLDGNVIENVEQIGCITSLQILSLQNNNLTRIPMAFRHLTNILQLSFQTNNLREINPAVIRDMANLQSLSLEANKLQMLPDMFKKLGSLDSLLLQKNFFGYLPASLANCSSLSFLDISYNQFKEFPEVLGKMPSLRKIEAVHNHIVEIPFWLCGIELKSLNLSYNELKSVSYGLSLMESLTHLNLSNNQISSLPPTLGALRNKLSQLNVSNNPITSPPQDVIKQGPTHILKYLNETLSSSQPASRLKLLVMGNHMSGKTSLVKLVISKWSVTSARPVITSGSGSGSLSSRSTEQNNVAVYTCRFQPRKTRKKKIEPQGDISVNLWDFAGQDVFYASHQFFMSRNAIYIVTFNIKESFEHAVDFWLRSIKARVRKPRVIIIGTHLDRCSILDRNLMEATILEKYSDFELVQFIPVSCKTEDGISEARNAIENLIYTHPGVEKKIPFSYINMETMLAERAKAMEYPIIMPKELLHLGSYCNLKTWNEVTDCTRTLHELGSIIYFHNVPNLSNLVILDPEWLIQVMAAIFAKKEWVKHGILDYSFLKVLWKNYPEQIHPKLIALLEKFEIAHTLDSTDTEVLRDISTDKTTQGSGTGSLVYSTSLEDIRTTNAVTSGSGSVSLSNGTGGSSIPSGTTTSGSSPAILQENSLKVPQRILISTLLPTERPEKVIEKRWNRVTEKVHFNRLYKFSFLPQGLFSRLLNCLINTVSIVAIWAHGLLAKTKSITINKDDKITNTTKDDSAEAELFVEQLSQKSTDLLMDELLVQVRSSSVSVGRYAFIRVLDVVERIAAEWPSVEVHRFVYRHFGPKRNSKSPIPIPILEGVISEGNFTFIYEDQEINIDQLVPDLSLAEFSGSRVSKLELQLGTVLGMGGYATVYKGTFRTKEMAIKVLKNAPNRPQQTEAAISFREEVLVQASLKHPCIIQIEAICAKPFCIVTEICKFGSLYDHLHIMTHSIPWRLRLKIALDIAQGIQYMHERKPPIAHLDMKSPNILLYSLNPADPVCAKIADFGTAQTITGSITDVKVGNPVWLAPEILDSKPYNETVDTYAFGIICYEILTRKDFFGEVPFLSVLQDRVIAGDRPTIPKWCNSMYKKLTRQCWQHDPKKRPSFDIVIRNLQKMKSITKELDEQCQSYENHLKTEYLEKEILQPIGETLETDRDRDRMEETFRSEDQISEINDKDLEEDPEMDQEDEKRKKMSPRLKTPKQKREPRQQNGKRQRSTSIEGKNVKSSYVKKEKDKNKDTDPNTSVKSQSEFSQTPSPRIRRSSSQKSLFPSRHFLEVPLPDSTSSSSSRKTATEIPVMNKEEMPVSVLKRSGNSKPSPPKLGKNQSKTKSQVLLSKLTPSKDSKNGPEVLPSSEQGEEPMSPTINSSSGGMETLLMRIHRTSSSEIPTLSESGFLSPKKSSVKIPMDFGEEIEQQSLEKELLVDKTPEKDSEKEDRTKDRGSIPRLWQKKRKV